MLSQKSRCRCTRAKGGCYWFRIGMGMPILDGQSRPCGTHWTDARCIFCISPGATGDRRTLLVWRRFCATNHRAGLKEGNVERPPCALVPHTPLQGSIPCGIDTSHLLEQVLETNR
jgi:hypothetical protein